MRAIVFLYWGAAYGLLGVLLGAFGAHGLRSRLNPEMISVWHTAVEYQFYHAFALLAVGILALIWPENTRLAWAGWLFASGVLVFSGSLYALALSGIRGLGAITPFGGVALILGWTVLLFALYYNSI